MQSNNLNRREAVALLFAAGFELPSIHLLTDGQHSQHLVLACEYFHKTQRQWMRHCWIQDERDDDNERIVSEFLAKCAEQVVTPSGDFWRLTVPHDIGGVVRRVFVLARGLSFAEAVATCRFHRSLIFA